MRTILLAAVLSTSLSAPAQYYYKDIIGTRESAEMVKAYTRNKVNKVVLSSFDPTNQKDEDFYVEQQFSLQDNSLKTVSKATTSNLAVLVSYFDKDGNIIKTVDSSDVVVTWTTYQYNPSGQLVSVVSSTSDSARTSHMDEQHFWQWNGTTPVRMLRIKNKRDTAFVDFKTDDRGNVIEEQETHRKSKAFPIFYYYNGNNQLTDIAQYNARVGQVLPNYMFEYSDKGQLIQKITVPANNSNYLIWRYQYNDNGLKIREAVYNKLKKLTGKIEYQYSFGQ